MVNLFEQTAEPIPLTQARYEYRIVPDVANPDGMEVYSVDAVISVDPIAGDDDRVPAVLLVPARQTREDASRRSGTPSRRPSLHGRSDRGTDVYLNLVDLDFDPSLPAESTLVVRTTCTNRDLPSVLQQAGERLYLRPGGGGAAGADPLPAVPVACRCGRRCGGAPTGG